MVSRSHAHENFKLIPCSALGAPKLCYAASDGSIAGHIDKFVSCWSSVPGGTAVVWLPVTQATTTALYSAAHPSINSLATAHFVVQHMVLFGLTVRWFCAVNLPTHPDGDLQMTHPDGDPQAAHLDGDAPEGDSPERDSSGVDPAVHPLVWSPTSWLPLAEALLRQQELRMVVLDFRGVAFPLLESDLQRIGAAWPNLQELHISHAISGDASTIPSLSAVYYLCRTCRFLRVLHLPVITTKGCLVLASNESASARSSPHHPPLRHLSSTILVLEHSAPTFADILTRLFPLLQMVGPPTVSKAWASVSSSLSTSQLHRSSTSLSSKFLAVGRGHVQVSARPIEPAGHVADRHCGGRESNSCKHLGRG